MVRKKQRWKTSRDWSHFLFFSFLCLKASALCKQVLSVAFSNELKEELQGKAFSILIVETTDTSTAKLLAVLVWHWDTRSHKMIDNLLILVEVDDACGESLFNVVEGSIFNYTFLWHVCKL